MSRVSQLGNNLYRGDVSFNVVANQRRWYAISAILLVIAVGSLAIRGLNFGVEFTGGSVFTVPSETCSVETARTAVVDAGVTDVVPIVTEVTGSSGRDIRVQTVSLVPERSATVATSLSKACGTPLNDVSTTVIGPSWGQAITQKALTGLVVFLGCIVLY
ncbi:MAG: protein translocase subunit SecF, partial [Actinomycetes bacterium]